MVPFNRQLLAFLGVLVALGGCACSAFSAPADESKIAVIASSRDHDVQTIDPGMLRDIYLKKIFLDPQGHAYIPVNLPPDDTLRREFSRSVIKMSESRLQNYWNRQYFQGVSPPYVLGSQTAVVEFVAETPGAIGYVEPCFLTPDVYTVLLLTLHGTPSTEPMERCPAPAVHKALRGPASRS
ncbi:MAG: hypothetical protein G3I10_08635 [Ferrovum sp.]|nr:hypothetical protein [Ferrovum sp.]